MKRIVFLILFVMLCSRCYSEPVSPKEEYLEEMDRELSDNTLARENELNPAGLKQKAQEEEQEREGVILGDEMADDPEEKILEDQFENDLHRDFD